MYIITELEKKIFLNYFILSPFTILNTFGPIKNLLPVGSATLTLQGEQLEKKINESDTSTISTNLSNSCSQEAECCLVSAGVVAAH